MNYKVRLSRYHINMGPLIRNLRFTHNITQKELSEKTHYTVQAIEEMESGRLYVNETKLKALAQVFNIHHEALRAMADTTRRI